MALNKKERTAGSSPFELRQTHNPESLTRALRALASELRAEGIADPVVVLRAGTLAMAYRALAAYRADGGRGVRWLEAVLRDGASRLCSADGLSERDRVRVAAFDELMAERGVSFGDAA